MSKFNVGDIVDVIIENRPVEIVNIGPLHGIFQCDDGFSYKESELEKQNDESEDVRDYNVGDSNYAEHKIQPWDIWEEYNLNPWDADIVKRVLRTKKSQSRKLDYEKIIHICQKRISQIDKEVDKE